MPNVNVINLTRVINLTIPTFSEHSDIFNVNELQSPLRHVLPQMAGFTSSFVIVSSSGAIFQWHIEEQVRCYISDHFVIYKSDYFITFSVHVKCQLHPRVG